MSRCICCVETCQSRKPKSVYLVIVTHRAAKISKFSALLVWLWAKKQKIRSVQSHGSADISLSQKFCCDRLFDSRKKRIFEMLSLFNNYFKVFQESRNYLTVLMQLLQKHHMRNTAREGDIFIPFLVFPEFDKKKSEKQTKKLDCVEKFLDCLYKYPLLALQYTFFFSYKA